jgi:hypothetical protein
MKLPGVDVEVVARGWPARWPALWLATGVEISWKHPARWTLWVAIIRRDRTWEFREHVVYAASQAVAVACLWRDLRAEEDWWQVRLVQLWKVDPPLTAAQVLDVERANAWLQREVAAAGARPRVA